MAITTQAQAGVVATSSAKSGTFAATPSGTDVNLGEVITGTGTGGDLETGASYAGRLLYVSSGSGVGQIRYITTDNGDGTAVISEEWDTIPASGDGYEVCYILNDLATVTGLTFQSKSQSYTSGRRAVVGNGTDFAFVGMLNGAFLESNDNSSTTVGDFTVENNGLFQSGYLQQGSPVSGGYYIAAPAVDGELGFDAKAGSTINLYDYQCRAVFSPRWEQDGGTHAWNKAKLFRSTYQMILLGTQSITDSTIEGASLTTDTCTISTGFSSDRLNFINMNGFLGNAAGTYELKNVTWIAPLLLITVTNGQTFNAINPVGWDSINTANQDKLAISGSGSVNWKYSLDTTVQQSDGTAIASPRVFLYEGTQTDSLVVDATGNASGVVSSDWIYRNYVDGGATNLTLTQYGNHAFRADTWTYFPFVAAQISNVAITGTTTLSVDNNIVETNQATAISAGTGVTWNEDTNPSTTVAYTSGTGTLNVGETVTASPSGATGIVTDILDGDSVAGTVHLRSRNGTAFANGDTLSSSGTFSGATYTNDSAKNFTIWIDANGVSMQGLYDYLAAESSNGTLGTIGTNIHTWGKSAQARALYSTGSSFYTERSGTEGVIAVNYGAGTIDYFTSDDGSLYVPPVQRTFTITNIIADSEIRLVRVSDLVEIAGVENVASSSTGLSNMSTASDPNNAGRFTATYSYILEADLPIYVVVAHLNYIMIYETFSLPFDENASLQIAQRFDRQYDAGSI